MKKYQPLSERLAGHEGPEWQASFAEIEEVLGFPLPKVARSGRAWWADAEKPHTRTWSQHGFAAEAGEGRVTFRRAAPVVVAEPLMAVITEDAPAAASGRKLSTAALVAGGVAMLAAVAALAVRRLSRKP